MAVRSPTRLARRQPRQRRARQTVEAILQAVVKVLQREGVEGITTNRIAEVAGVSIGSVYQYFPDKAAIFAALHQRHVDAVDRMLQARLLQHAASSLEALVRALVEAMVELHAAEPELHELLSVAVPNRTQGTRDFAMRLQGVFRLAIAARARELKKRRGLQNLDKTVFVVTHMVEALSHGAVLRRPPGLSLAEAKDEAVRAVLAYLRS